MKIEKITGLLQVTANIGIVAGLVVVLLQMQQTEKLLSLQITNQYYDSYIASENSLVGDNFAEIYQKSIDEPENLTIGEMRLLENHTFVPLNRWIGLYRMYEAGLMDASMWKSQVDLDVSFYFGDIYGRTWWQRNGTGFNSKFMPPELVSYIDAELEAVPETYNANGFRELREMVREKVAARQQQEASE